MLTLAWMWYLHYPIQRREDLVPKAADGCIRNDLPEMEMDQSYCGR